MKMSLMSKSLLIACCLSQSSVLYAQESGLETLDETQQVEQLALDELELLEEITNEQTTISDQSIAEESIAEESMTGEIESSSDNEMIVELESTEDETIIQETQTEKDISDIVIDKIDVTQIQYTRTLPADGNIIIPTANDASVFAEFTDALPAVINYYTKLSEAEIIHFYENFYGESITQERKRGRLTVNYFFNQLSVRLVISTQNDFQQVDVMVEELM